MSLRVKKSQRGSGPGGHAGQAMVEYVLMLIITVSLVLALITQIFRPMQDFLQAYMGDYVSCLLELGELPSFGGDDTTAKDEGCNARFAEATLANGRPPLGGGSGSNENGDSSGSNSGDQGGSADGSSDGGGDRSGGSSRSGTYAGSASRARGYSRVPMYGRGPSGLDGGMSEKEKGKIVEITLDNGGGGGFFTSNNNSTSVRRRPTKKRSIGLAGLTDEDKKKLEKKEISGRSTVTPAEGLSPAVKKITVKQPTPKDTFVEEEKPLTIGNFIRYLFIAAIVIALVIFIGGQALQMSKGSE